MFTTLLVALLSLFAIQPTPTTPPPPRDDTAAESLGWRLGCQAWTFRDRSTFATIDTIHTLGLKYIELYPGQQLDKDPAVKIGPDLTEEQIASLKAKLKGQHITAVNYGVVTFKNDEKDARRHFNFAKKIGLETITCEPEPDAWPLVEKLADEYKINTAVHDHPKPSRYWNPDTVLDSVKDRSKRCGACADTGHWSRSGLVPVDCLKKLEGRIISLHFKDITNNEDKPWGTGNGNAKGMLEELHRQHFKGVFCVEYETGSGKELEQNVAKCIQFFDATAKALAPSQTNEPRAK